MTAQYWSAFEEYSAKRNRLLELRSKKGLDYFRIIWMDDIPFSRAHLCVVASSRSSRLRGPGNRVQLVLFGKKADAIYRKLLSDKGRFDSAIPNLHWLAPPDTEPRHIEVVKPAHLESPSRWQEDFDWLLTNLERFRDVFESDVRRAVELTK